MSAPIHGGLFLALLGCGGVYRSLVVEATDWRPLRRPVLPFPDDATVPLG
jgi:hypothetical protein